MVSPRRASSAGPTSRSICGSGGASWQQCAPARSQTRANSRNLRFWWNTGHIPKPRSNEMPHGNKPLNHLQTRQAGQRFAALIAAAVLLLLAIAFIGISHASRLGAAGPQLPPAKATLLAQGDAT